MRAARLLRCGLGHGPDCTEATDGGVRFGVADVEASADLILVSVLASMAEPPDADDLTARILGRLRERGLLPTGEQASPPAPDAPGADQ